MKINKTVSIAASIAIIGMGVIGLTGCQTGGETASVVGSTTTQQRTQTGVIEGRVLVDSKGSDRRVLGVDNSGIQVTATNLGDGTTYDTVTDRNGLYRIANATYGEYQIVAKKEGRTLAGVTKVNLRDTKVVNVQPVVLTATGTLKAHIDTGGYGQRVDVVYIPGTSYIAIPDDQGNFELSNVPVGEYTLRFDLDDEYYDHYPQSKIYGYNEMQGNHIDKDVKVEAGKKDIGTIALYQFSVRGAYLGDSVNQLNENGISVYLNEPVTLDSFKAATKLIDANGNEIAVDVQTWQNEGGGSTEFVVKPKNPVDAGTYTLSIAKSLTSTNGHSLGEAFTRTWTLHNYIDLYTSHLDSNGLAHTVINLDFPKAVSESDRSKDVNVTDSSGNALPNMTTVWVNPNSLRIAGDFDRSKTYRIVLDPYLESTYGKLRSNTIDFSQMGTIGFVNSTYSSSDPHKQHITFGAYNQGFVDLSSVKVVVQTPDSNKTYTEKDIDFNDYQNSGRWADLYGNIVFDMNYSTTYKVTVSLKNVWGEEDHQTSTFSTITPRITYIDTYFSDSSLRHISFNVPVDSSEASVVFKDMETNATKTLPVKEQNGEMYYDLENIGKVGDFIKPAHSYMVTAQGFKTKDGYSIDEKSDTFTAPPVSIRNISIPNGSVDIDPNNVQNRIKFQFFGHLSEAQKSAIENALVVTSYGLSMPTDITHPEPKVFWSDENEFGTMMGVSFTMDEDRGYELALKNSDGTPAVINGVVLEEKLLTFKTIDNQAATTAYKPLLYVINNFYSQGINLVKDVNQTAKGYVLNLYADIKVPVKVIEDEYGNQSCGNPLEKEDVIPKIRLMDSAGNDINLTEDDLSLSSYISNESYYYNGKYYRKCYQYLSVYKDVNITAFDQNLSYTLDATAFESDFMDLKDLRQTINEHMDKFGDVEIYVDNYYQSGEVLEVQVASMTPMRTKDLNLSSLNLSTDPEVDILSINYSNSPYDMIKDDRNDTYVQHFTITMAKPKYGFLKLAIGGNGGIKGYNPFVGSAQAMLDSPVEKLLEVTPDLTPLSVAKVEPMDVNETLNRAIKIDFSRLVKPEDVATFDENGTLLSAPFKLDHNLSIIGAELEEEFVTSDVYGVKSATYTLSSAMDVDQNYTLSLDANKTIHALAGDYEIESYSTTVEPALARVKYVGLFYTYRAMRNNYFENPISADGNTVYSDYDNQYSAQAMVLAANGVDINTSYDAIDVIQNGYSIDDSDSMWVGETVFQDLDSYSYYNPVTIDVDIPVSSVTRKEKLHLTKSYGSYSYPYLSTNYVSWVRYDSDGIMRIRFNNYVNPGFDENYFVVYDVNGSIVPHTDLVTNLANSNYVEVDLNTSVLDVNSTYALFIKDVPNNSTFPPKGTMIDAFKFTTPAAATSGAAAD